MTSRRSAQGGIVGRVSQNVRRRSAAPVPPTPGEGTVAQARSAVKAAGRGKRVTRRLATPHHRLTSSLCVRGPHVRNMENGRHVMMKPCGPTVC